jgi:hypothetical protein
MHKKTKAQVPVERVMNSIGLAVKSSWKPNTTNLTKGNSPRIKIKNLIT